ncbi:MAG: porin family protein [Bacteroidales bacterium]|nr:porin family protein [Bacteroidales bacterium]MCF8343294.1 porin family protein [Bacteroidales bacterium]MCF8375528.1 porin family protein [Bacteroidales bacterium]MCF8399927.1 porin family protein [Bacteroidales bacterium]
MKTKVFITGALMMILTINGMAQENNKRWGFEFGSGASFALSQPDETRLNTGFGFEGIFHYRFLPHTGVYAGWGWNRFGSDESFAGDDVCFEETGYVLGIEFKHPVNNSALAYYLRAGGLYNHIEIENAEGEIIEDSGHGMGFQLATGIDIPLGNNWSLTPGVKYNNLSREVETEGVRRDMDYNYISARIGFLKRF